MDLNSLPVWAQQFSAILLTLGTAMTLRWAEKRKKPDPAPALPGGDATVVAASFVEKRLMERLIECVASLHVEMVKMNGHVEKLNERMHEDEIVRAAVAKMKEGRG